MRTFVATKNAGKLREMRAIFERSPLRLETFAEYRDVEETSDSFEGNATLKALALHEQLRGAGIEAAVLADDSGLEVNALGGRPGIHSARYGGENITWPQRRLLLLDELTGVSPERRGARFVSALAFVEPHGRLRSARGTVEGRITEREAGEHGFGYDPLFWYPPRSCTFAQLDPGEKNRVSHRQRAADALLASLRDDG
ncbi:MAG TPA: RdgB/HAM1 family non-canonical purine NTP pyrophosphatase [Candidatus Tumulicola sp.]|jgi:XTP/dITP diphosphohydrolase